MARKRRTSAVLETARQRLAGLKSIIPAPDFGGNLNAAGGQAAVTDCADELDSYNQNNAALDEQQNVVDTKKTRQATGASASWRRSALSTAPTAANTKWSAAPAPANARSRKRKAPAALSRQRLKADL